MAMKAEKGSGQTSRNYRKGMKDALKSNKYKPTSQKKGQFKTISGKLAKKAKAGDKYSAGAGAAFSMLRQEKAMSNRGGGGTASAAVANRKRVIKKTTVSPTKWAKQGSAQSSYGPRPMSGGMSTTKKKQSTSSKKEIGKGIVGAIKANKNKPIAQKKSRYTKLDAMLRNRKSSAEKTGNYTASQRAEGGLRGLSVLRQDAAAGRRGASKPMSAAAKAGKAMKKSKAATRNGKY